MAFCVDEGLVRLKGLKAAKPATLKTLQSSLASWFKPSLAAADVELLLHELVGRKKLTAVGTKVTYSLG